MEKIKFLMFFQVFCLVFRSKFSVVVASLILAIHFGDGKNVATDMELANQGQSFTPDSRRKCTRMYV